MITTQSNKVLWSAAALNRACVPGQKVMWTHLELSGRITKDRKPGPNMGLPGITPTTLLQVLVSPGTEIILMGLNNLPD